LAKASTGPKAISAARWRLWPARTEGGLGRALLFRVRIR
jgi:hypothetical protein